MVRIDKVLSNFGFCTRKYAAAFLDEHEVTFRGSRVNHGTEKVIPAELDIDDEPLDHSKGIFVALYKPAGYVCSHNRSEGKTVFDLLPQPWLLRTPQLTTVGRLDKDTTGLLLLTNVPGASHALTAPSRHVEKTYIVTVDQNLDESIVGLFAAGTILLHGEQKPCLPAQVSLQHAREASITLHEGRYHQVKRMFAAAGYHVTRLHRSSFGTYTLGELTEGRWVDLPLP